MPISNMPLPNLGEVLATLNKLKTMIDSLRRRVFHANKF